MRRRWWGWIGRNEETQPDRSILTRWLKRATQKGLIRRTGTRNDPFVYWLTEREPLLFPGLGASAEERAAWKERRTAEVRRFFKQPA